MFHVFPSSRELFTSFERMHNTIFLSAVWTRETSETVDNILHHLCGSATVVAVLKAKVLLRVHAGNPVYQLSVRPRLHGHRGFIIVPEGRRRMRVTIRALGAAGGDFGLKSAVEVC